ncbi:endo-1,4-beta-xylanase [Methylobacterium brachythecii]|uniref:Beta-xylanase n=1 Tax=Methylobacterium brachythecii TaxID=1176177 RepID=A0A7W6APY7_9HYPH|nr:endo-1,4-beta-xylanase [Methylobacterium brachythecii]MBB3904576.1 endo-1,4-beta-xylanase [Methylobacterium brachythecii]GLS46361.1 beta-xylanase [Methylobacterium brachythecii]
MLASSLAAAGLPCLDLSARAAAGPGVLARAVYGAAVRGDALANDPAYAEAVAARCRTIVPEGSLKWPVIRPNRETFDFGDADRIAAFAGRHGIGLRGHTLAWYGGMPSWTDAITSRAEAERVLSEHIERVVSRYAGLITSWDVVNEPIPDAPSSPGDLRPFVWTRTLGADYIPIAFRAAASADPTARLVLNEYDVEFAGARFKGKRDALLAIARRLVDSGVPLHAIGLQAHLFADRSIDRDGLQAFLREIRAMKLDVLVTELDVVDVSLPGDVEARDRQVAEMARAFLSAVAEVIPPSTILTWGISDRYTWVPTYFTRPDGLPNRPLPLDAAMRPKPLMAVIERYTRSAS